jgi:hypothetical protein
MLNKNNSKEAFVAIREKLDKYQRILGLCRLQLEHLSDKKSCKQGESGPVIDLRETK